MRRVLAGLALAVLLAAGGCDKDRGAGTLTLSVSADVPLGGVVVELRGRGIEGVDPLPGGWVEGHAFTDASGDPGYRIVAVLEAPGELRLGVRVADLDRRLPAAAILEASGADDRPVQPLGSVEVTLRR